MIGLSNAEAKRRLQERGKNVLVEEKRKTVLEVFFGQFADLLVAILIAAVLFAPVVGELFAITTMSGASILAVVICAIIPAIILQTIKII